MLLLYDDLFQYPDPFGRLAHCRLRVYRGLAAERGRVVVVATEVPDNPGTAIVHVARELPSYALSRLGVEPIECLHWFVHYPAHDTLPESFSAVQCPPDGSERWFSLPRWFIEHITHHHLD